MVISSEFPNDQQATKGIFIKQQIVELAKLCSLKVIAPVPWSVPLGKFKKSYIFSRVKKKEACGDIEVFHPRYFLTPKLGRAFYGLFYFLGIYKTAKAIACNFDYDLILAYFAYPDGFAAAWLAKVFRKPLVIKVMGSDINLYTRGFLRRCLTVYTLKQAGQVIAVTEDLKKKMIALGVGPDKIAVVYNGVDSHRFKPMDTLECRKELGLPQDKTILLFIGAFRKIKGVDYLVDAYAKLSENNSAGDLSLILIGDGELKNKIKDKIDRFGLRSKVRLAGIRPHQEIPRWINACDILCLTSEDEGCPNVILEALACGKPVVAAKVGGIPEIVNSADYGNLFKSHSIEELTLAIQAAVKKKWDPEIIKARIAYLTWEKTAKEILALCQARLSNIDTA